MPPPGPLSLPGRLMSPVISGHRSLAGGQPGRAGSAGAALWGEPLPAPAAAKALPLVEAKVWG